MPVRTVFRFYHDLPRVDIETTLINERTTHQREDGPSEAAQRVVTLGFAKVKKDKWGIALHEEVKSKKGVIEDRVSLLRKADRSLRLAALPPLEAVHSCVAMGASIGMAAGAAHAGYTPAVAAISQA